MHADGISALAPFVCVCPAILVALLGTVFWLWMLVDCLTKEPAASNEKILWTLVILLTHLLGALLYYLIRRPERIRLSRQ